MQNVRQRVVRARRQEEDEEEYRGPERPGERREVFRHEPKDRGLQVVLFDLLVEVDGGVVQAPRAELVRSRSVVCVRVRVTSGCEGAAGGRGCEPDERKRRRN